MDRAILTVIPLSPFFPPHRFNCFGANPSCTGKSKQNVFFTWIMYHYLNTAAIFSGLEKTRTRYQGLDENVLIVGKFRSVNRRNDSGTRSVVRQLLVNDRYGIQIALHPWVDVCEISCAYRSPPEYATEPLTTLTTTTTTARFIPPLYSLPTTETDRTVRRLQSFVISPALLYNISKVFPCNFCTPQLFTIIIFFRWSQ